MLIGYAKVSTDKQNLKLQKDALKAAGCEKIFKDVGSGARVKDERPGLNKALKYIRKGDTLVVWRLDRLARSLKQLIDLDNELQERKVGLKSIQESIDTTTSGGKLIFHMFGALAEFERDVIRERTKAGLAAASARGRSGGRPEKLNKRQIALAKKLHKDKSYSIGEICNTLSISKASLYRYLNNG